LNLYDSSFWGNGQQLQVFSNRFIKIKQPLEKKDVIRVAIDLRHASQFARIWKETRIGNNNISMRERVRDNGRGNAHD